MTITTETRVATLSLLDDGLMEVRFRPGVKLDVDMLAELQVARKELAGGSPRAVLTSIPEDIDFDMSVMNTDHYRPHKAEEVIIALALVTLGSMNELLAKLYFTYFPTAFNAKIFSAEAPARAWLAERLAEAANSGPR